MKYCAFILTDPALFQRSCRMMAFFLEAQELEPSDGTTILIGKELPDEAEQMLPTKTAIHIEMDILDSERILEEVFPLCSENMNLFAADRLSEELAVRLSVRLNGTSMTDVAELSRNEASLQVKKPVYGGHVSGTFLMEGAPFCISLNKGIGETDPVSGEIVQHHLPQQEHEGSISDSIITHETGGSDLDNANFVIIGGRGLRGKEGAMKLSEFASSLSASAGCTRPVAMNAWMPFNKLVGVSGSLIHPDLCIVCAASGSPAFYEGIKRSRIIVAVNTDEHAPIMKKADVCICVDWKDLLQELSDSCAKIK